MKSCFNCKYSGHGEICRDCDFDFSKFEEAPSQITVDEDEVEIMGNECLYLSNRYKIVYSNPSSKLLTLNKMKFT